MPEDKNEEKGNEGNENEEKEEPSCSDVFGKEKASEEDPEAASEDPEDPSEKCASCPDRFICEILQLLDLMRLIGIGASLGIELTIDLGPISGKISGTITVSP